MSKKNLFNIDNLSAQDLDENSELIPLMTPEDEIEISKEELPQTLPILSLSCLLYTSPSPRDS